MESELIFFVMQKPPTGRRLSRKSIYSHVLDLGQYGAEYILKYFYN